MPNVTLGEVVKNARDSLRLTQRDLAVIVGVKASHITYIENNQRRPSIALLGNLADALSLDRREALYLAYPDAKHLITESQRTESPWKQFSASRALLERYQVSQGELRVLKQISILEQISHPRHFVFVLNAIRLAALEP
jgi:transcriptional regulator with XRE-family HTH domain